MGSGKMENDNHQIGGARKSSLRRQRSGGSPRNANFLSLLEHFLDQSVGPGKHRHRCGR